MLERGWWRERVQTEGGDVLERGWWGGESEDRGW